MATRIHYAPAPKLTMTPTQVFRVRNSLHMSKVELALLLKVSEQAVSHWEAGRRQISSDNTYRLVTHAKSKGIDVDWAESEG